MYKAIHYCDRCGKETGDDHSSPYFIRTEHNDIELCSDCCKDVIKWLNDFNNVCEDIYDHTNEDVL